MPNWNIRGIFSCYATGRVNGYRDAEAIAADLVALGALGYEIERFDCSAWHDEAAMHAEVAARLDFPDYYGRNFDALDDCLTDTEVLAVPVHSGLVLTLEHLDGWPGRQGALVEVLAEASRYWSLFGRRIIVLVSVSRPSWAAPPHLADTRLSWWP